MSLRGAIVLSKKAGAPSSPRICFCGGARLRRPATLAFVGLLAALPACAQYPGQVTKTGKDTPELRAIAVVEWTGDPGKPKTSRLVPVAVLDGGQLQDGGIYMARPEPLSLAGEVEYELEQDGKPIGLFDIRNAGQEQGSWVGYGAWKPLAAAKPARHVAPAKIDDDDAQSDEPVLHRKHHDGDPPSKNGGSGTDSTGNEPASDPDPDRPVLHKKPANESPSDSSSTTAGTGATNPSASGGDAKPSQSSDQNPDTSADPDRPTLHRRSSGDGADDGSGTSSVSDDPDRPVLKKKRPVQDVADVESLPDVTDPDRPRLKRGQSNGDSIQVLPSLMGLPQDLQQAVAVSDAKTHPVHPWSFSWSSPDDEAKLKSALEDIARAALQRNPPAAKAAPRRTPSQTTTHRSARPTPPAPVELMDEQFHVFELAYGSGATLVLTAHTEGPAAQQKFVTLIAQPDLYGNILVLFKSVTDGSHLDDTPRMRLVDAVDAMADNRGELLFELRGATQRQFALYRVLRGQAEQLFITGAADLGVANSE
jgi:hypothetical protein